MKPRQIAQDPREGASAARKALGGRRNKFGAQKTRTDGITFASKREARRWGDLRTMERIGAISELERQVPYDLVVNGEQVCRYIADFRYRLPDVGVVVEDAKGVKTREYRIKAKLMKACHGIVIREI